ncbi:phenylacetate--CoA ligase family protein, partial [Haloferax profundi]|uniref:phenylacetate--CoA ligase family protein n=1 Tax=Haloferax profundi TaxID=1544718 RepID=UPI0012F77CCF
MGESDSEDVTRLPRPELRDVQNERVRAVVEHAYENVDFYRRKLDSAGVHPSDIQSVDDLSKLPFTTKEDFRDEYPTGLFAVDMDDVVRIHASSGTTGKPKIVGYTQDDLDVWREVMSRGFRGAGLTSDDSLQNAYSYGLFTGGFGFHDGATAMGMTVVPTGGGNTQRQVEMLADLDVDSICLTPSYALYLAEVAEDMGYDPADLPLSTILYGAEPCTEPMRREIETRFDATAVENYGLSEIIGPGVAVECLEQAGMHIWEDHFYPEVV